jgi:hypothetical protein
MGTLWSELASVADEGAAGPRVYADANVPAGVVAFMRATLGWDFRLARQLRRTLFTMDRDYLDDRTFPPAETAGVVVLSAPDERGLQRLLDRVNRDMFHPNGHGFVALPLDGSKLQVFPEFGAGR